MVARTASADVVVHDDQNEAQKSDYGEAFLDWVFWWLLATIELIDRLASRDS